MELTKVLSGQGDPELAETDPATCRSAITSSITSRGWCARRGRKDPTAPDFVKKMVDYGAGPRAGQFLRDAGKALAAMDGRFSVAIDDIKKAAIPVLRHRISTNFQAQAEGKTSEDVIQQLLATFGEPEVGKYEKRKR